MSHEILYIFNEMINIVFRHSDIGIQNQNNNVTDSAMKITFNDGKIDDCSGFLCDNLIKIIEKYQTDYYTKPLIGYHAQQLIDENKKLKEENEKANTLYQQIESEKDNVEQMQSKLDKDMKKYNDIKDLEKRWFEIKEHNSKVDILSEKIRSDRDELEKKKLKFEMKKKIFDQSQVEIDIKNTQLGNDFMDFINKETITVNNVQLDTKKLCEHGKNLSKEYDLDIWILDIINEMFYYISRFQYIRTQKIKIDANLPKKSQIENIKKEFKFGQAQLFHSENIIMGCRANTITITEQMRGHVGSQIHDLFPQCNTVQQKKPIKDVNSVQQKKTTHENECGICFDEITELYTFVPCGHCNVCTKCYNAKNFKICPLCNSGITSRIKLYLYK